MATRSLGALLPGTVLALAAAALAGCVAEVEAEGTVTVCVQDQDQVAEFSSVFVTFSQVEVKRAEKGEAEEVAPAPTTPTPTETGNETENETAGNETGNETEETTEQEDVFEEEEAFVGVVTCAEPPAVTAEEEVGVFEAENETGNETENETSGNETGNETGTETENETETEGELDVEDEDEGLFDEEEESEVTERGAQWLTITTEPTTVDLLAFSGNEAALLGSAGVPAQDYSHLRIVVDEAWGETADGGRVDIQVPSGELLLRQDFAVDEDGETTLVVDFDLDRSLQPTGADVWILRPVVRLEVQPGVPAGEPLPPGEPGPPEQETGESPEEGPFP